MKKFVIKNSGYITCHSNFYSVEDVLNDQVEYEFHSGINEIIGEIDSGIFGISYLISMYEKINKSTVFLPHVVRVEGTEVHLSEFAKKCCYMDSSYDLFNSEKTVKKLVSEGIASTNLPYSTEDIRNKFFMESFRYNRPISKTGNERFQAMAAIGFANGKDVFCFPWLSNRRFEYYEKRLTHLFGILAREEKTVIVPRGNT